MRSRRAELLHPYTRSVRFNSTCAQHLNHAWHLRFHHRNRNPNLASFDGR